MFAFFFTANLLLCSICIYSRCFYVQHIEGSTLQWSCKTWNGGTDSVFLLFTSYKLTASNRNSLLTDVLILLCCSMKYTLCLWSVKNRRVLLGRYANMCALSSLSRAQADLVPLWVFILRIHVIVCTLFYLISTVFICRWENKACTFVWKGRISHWHSSVIRQGDLGTVFNWSASEIAHRGLLALQLISATVGIESS